MTISTGDLWFAGTGGDVYLNLLGVDWGVLETDDDDFERNTTQTFDLFQQFPDSVPANPTVGQLYGAEATLSLQHKDSWFPTTMTITINGRDFVQLTYDDWIGSGDSLAATIGTEPS
ncbi:MAG: PLAT/LH2 domain-containing protein [Planctomycetota bacterium]